MPSFCKSCDAEVIWVTTTKGKAIPLDPMPHPEGNIELTQDGPRHFADVLAGPGLSATQRTGAPLYRAHFVTCPDADAHRRKK